MYRAITTIVALLFIFTGLATHAEPIGYFTPDDVTYDPAIPTPEAFLRHELGAQPVRPDRMVDYLRTVAGLSDRISIETIGYSMKAAPSSFWWSQILKTRAGLKTSAPGMWHSAIPIAAHSPMTACRWSHGSITGCMGRNRLAWMR